MLKSFKELIAFDTSSYEQKKPTFKNKKPLPESKWLSYIEWAVVLRLLYDNGAEKVRYGTLLNSTEYPAVFDSNGENPFVSVWVEIDDERYAIEYPVLGINTYTKKAGSLNIHTAQQRAFVKCVAINTGLGLSLWIKDEAFMADQLKEDTTSNAASNDAKKRFLNAFNRLLGVYQEHAVIHGLLGTTKEGFEKLMGAGVVSEIDAQLERMNALLANPESFKSAN